MTPKTETTELYKTGDVLRLTRCPRQTFYQYINAGLIEGVQQTKGGHNLYDDETLKKVHIIRQLNENGYTLQSIREIFFRRR